MECASSVVATLLEGHALGGRALRSDSSRFTRWRRACFLRLIETYSLWTSTGTCHSTRQLLPLGKRLNSCLLHPLKLRRLLKLPQHIRVAAQLHARRRRRRRRVRQQLFQSIRERLGWPVAEAAPLYGTVVSPALARSCRICR